MPLSSLFKRKPAPGAESPAAKAAGDEPPLVAAARVRARRRLIGAVVLLGVGIVGFPLLFETAPRPIPVDIPIEIPRKDGVAPLTLPPMPAPRAAASGGVPTVAAIELPVDAGAELPPSATVAPASAPIARSSASAPIARSSASAPIARSSASAPIARSPASASASASASAPAAKASSAVAVKPAGDAQRARALLDGTAAAAPAPTASGADDKAAARFVVQVGAYTDPNALREARAKVEKLGLKTYTQVIETEAGKRTRVRIGPFASREDADAAVRTLKTAGLPGNILAL